MEMLEYSVLMSIYIKDKAEYVDCAIKSMLNQTHKPEQYVIVEDGEISYDVQQVLNNYSKNYPDLFTRVKLKNNKGLASALNEGLTYCRNELVARMDSDDISLPDRCEKEVKLFEKNNRLIICGTNIDEFYENIDNITTSRIVPEKYDDILKFSKKRMPFNHPTVMYRKSFVLEFGGYDPKLRRKEDFDLFSKMLVGGCYVQNISESLLYYRADEGNYMRRKSFYTLKNAFLVYTRHLKRGGCNIIDYIILCGGEFRENLLFHRTPGRTGKRL